MNTRRSMMVLAALVMTTPVSAAPAKGKITSLIPSSPVIETCALETVKVTGTGRCPFTIFWGDNSPNTLVLVPLRRRASEFPVVSQHAYSKPGTFTVKAQGKYCKGTPTTTVQVAGPSIKSMFLFSQVTPGGWVILVGENFGSLPGQVWIHLTDYQGNSHDYQLLDTQSNWADTFVAGQIPMNLPGFPDQQATFTVVAQCGAASKGWSAGFIATKDFVDLAYVGNPPNHSVPWFQCKMSSGATDSDKCEDSGHDNFPQECMGPGFTPWADSPLGNLGGYHASGIGFQGNGGNDQFWLTTPLQNGWVLDTASVDWTTKVNNGGQVSVDSSLTTDPGTPDPRLGVDWYVNNCGGIFYQGHMIVTGPLGVPF